MKTVHLPNILNFLESFSELTVCRFVQFSISHHMEKCGVFLGIQLLAYTGLLCSSATIFRLLYSIDVVPNRILSLSSLKFGTYFKFSHFASLFLIILFLFTNYDFCINAAYNSSQSFTFGLPPFLFRSTTRMLIHLL